MPSNYPDGDPFIREHWRALLVLALLAILVLWACRPTDDTHPVQIPDSKYFYVWHDPDRPVTCWLYDGPEYGATLACLPDKEIQ